MKNETASSSDSPGVLVFPPVLLFGTVLVGVVLGVWLPWRFMPAFVPGVWARIVGAIIVLSGVALARWGRNTMVRAGTNVPPHKPALAIVTTGPFRFTRNPLYLGGTVAYVGLAILLDSAWLLVLLVPMVLVLQWGIILREERYLAAKFGEVYVAYKGRVRRWF